MWIIFAYGSFVNTVSEDNDCTNMGGVFHLFCWFLNFDNVNFYGLPLFFNLAWYSIFLLYVQCICVLVCSLKLVIEKHHQVTNLYNYCLSNKCHNE